MYASHRVARLVVGNTTIVPIAAAAAIVLGFITVAAATLGPIVTVVTAATVILGPFITAAAAAVFTAVTTVVVYTVTPAPSVAVLSSLRESFYHECDTFVLA